MVGRARGEQRQEQQISGANSVIKSIWSFSTSGLTFGYKATITLLSSLSSIY
jgi:hypothetical protein